VKETTLLQKSGLGQFLERTGTKQSG